MTRSVMQLDIDARYELKQEQIESFRERGFVKLKEVLSPEVVVFEM